MSSSEKIQTMRDALDRVSKWFGEVDDALPSWQQRDAIRKIASDALAATADENGATNERD